MLCFFMPGRVSRLCLHTNKNKHSISCMQIVPEFGWQPVSPSYPSIYCTKTIFRSVWIILSHFITSHRIPHTTHFESITQKLLTRSRNANLVTSDNNDLLSSQQLLSYNRSKTTKKVVASIDDDSALQHCLLIYCSVQTRLVDSKDGRSTVTYTCQGLGSVRLLRVFYASFVPIFVVEFVQ